MTLNHALLSLLDAVGTSERHHIVGMDTIDNWPPEALNIFINIGLLTATNPPQSMTCPGCEQHCFMDIQQLSNEENQIKRYFIVCNDPDMQEQMGRIEIHSDQLQQWKITPLLVARVVADLLDLEFNAEDTSGQTSIRIGMMTGKYGRRWLSLNASPLRLAANQHDIPVDELLYFDGDKLQIDQQRIKQLIETKPFSNQKYYTPSTDKRENRKQNTAAMYRDWQDEYSRLRRQHPDTTRHTDNWIATQIAKMDIAQGRQPETIRKNMKS